MNRLVNDTRHLNGLNEMTLEYDLAKMYCDENRLIMKTLGDVELFCYTKEEFFSRDNWDYVTKQHRGKLYLKGRPINKPFPKIFNLDETPECSEDNVKFLLETQDDWRIYDKANGHLFIVSYYIDDEGFYQVAMTTKGSIVPSEENVLLTKDIELFNEKYKEFYDGYVMEGYNRYCIPLRYATLMFEVIADYDKHTLYDIQTKMYGNDNCLVLLGGYYSNDAINWCNIELNFIESCGQTVCAEHEVNTRVAFHKFNMNDLASWKNHIGTEGYVIHFPEIDFRVKIKTNEYWKLRFKKDLTVERILQIFKISGIDRILLKIPEEVSGRINNVIENCMIRWYERRFKLRELTVEMLTWTDKQIFTCEHLNLQQKIFCKDWKNTDLQDYHFCLARNKTVDRLTSNSSLREEFVGSLNEYSDIINDIQTAFLEIAETV